MDPTSWSMALPPLHHRINKKATSRPRTKDGFRGTTLVSRARGSLDGDEPQTRITGGPPEPPTQPADPSPRPSAVSSGVNFDPRLPGGLAVYGPPSLAGTLVGLLSPSSPSGRQLTIAFDCRYSR